MVFTIGNAKPKISSFVEKKIRVPSIADMETNFQFHSSVKEILN